MFLMIRTDAEVRLKQMLVLVTQIQIHLIKKSLPQLNIYRINNKIMMNNKIKFNKPSKINMQIY